MQLVPSFPAVVLQRVSLGASSDFNQAVILAVLIIFGLTLLCWPLAAVIRKHFRVRLELEPGYMRLRPWVRVVCAVDIAFLLIFFIAITSDNPGALSARADAKLHAIQVLGLAGALGTLIVFLAFLRSWRDQHLWFWTKVWNLLVLLACVGFVWFSYHWNLLNFNLNY
jgi:hypothetical protein